MRSSTSRATAISPITLATCVQHAVSNDLDECAAADSGLLPSDPLNLPPECIVQHQECGFMGSGHCRATAIRPTKLATCWQHVVSVRAESYGAEGVELQQPIIIIISIINVIVIIIMIIIIIFMIATTTIVINHLQLFQRCLCSHAVQRSSD